MKKMALLICAIALMASSARAETSEELAEKLRKELNALNKKILTIAVGPVNTLLLIRARTKDKWDDGREMRLDNMRSMFTHAWGEYKRGLDLIEGLHFLAKEEDKLKCLNNRVRPIIKYIEEVDIKGFVGSLKEIYMPLSPTIDFYRRIANDYFLPDDADFEEVAAESENLVYIMKTHVNYIAVLRDEDMLLPGEKRIMDSLHKDILDECGRIFLRPQIECWKMLCELKPGADIKALKGKLKKIFADAEDDIDSQIRKFYFYLPRSPVIDEWILEGKRK